MALARRLRVRHSLPSLYFCNILLRYSREVQLQVQALDEAGQDVPFEEMAVTIHM